MNLFTSFQNVGNADMKFSKNEGDNRSDYQLFRHDIRLDIRSNKITGRSIPCSFS